MHLPLILTNFNRTLFTPICGRDRVILITITKHHGSLGCRIERAPNYINLYNQTAACWTCRRWLNMNSVCKMLDELEWPSLETRRDQSSLLLFHKIYCGAVSIEKDKYMTPAHSSKTTRSSHSAQYPKHQTYSNALENSFFPWTIPLSNSISRSSSVANTQSTEEFRALLFNQKFSLKLLCFFLISSNKHSLA